MRIRGRQIFADAIIIDGGHNCVRNNKIYISRGSEFIKLDRGIRINPTRNGRGEEKKGMHTVHA